MEQRPARPGLHGAPLRKAHPVELVRLGRARWGVRERLELRAPAGFLCPAAADFIRGVVCWFGRVCKSAAESFFGRNARKLV